MIAVNKPPNTAKLAGKKSAIVTITRKDDDPIPNTSPVFVNERFAPISIECLPNKSGKQTCIITNIYGQKSVVDGIGFINQQVRSALVNVFQHPDGTMRTRMDFKDTPPVCEIFGVKDSLNLKCSDAPIQAPPPSYNSMQNNAYQRQM